MGLCTCSKVCLAYLVLIPPRNGLGRIHPLVEKKHLGSGGSQFRLCRAKGGPGRIHMPRHFIQLGLQGSGPALFFDLDQLKPFLELALEIRTSRRHLAINFF